MIRNIIFDWSGTLVDDLPAVLEATNHVLGLAGRSPMTMADFRKEFQLPFEGFYRRVIPEIPLPELETWFHARFREAQASAVALPHAHEFLKTCRARGIRILLLSTLHPAHYEVQSRQTGFAPFVDHAYVGILDKREKIRELMEQHGLVAGETLFVGDMQHDIDTAHVGGVFSCGVLTGYNRLEQLRASRPHLIVEHLGELSRLLDRWAWDLATFTQSGSESTAAPGRLPVSTVGALIFDHANRVLLVRTHKWSDRLGIPGGKIHWGESSEDALRRELKEETGLDVRDIRFVMVQDCILSTEFYRPEHFLLLNYECMLAGPPDVRLNHEAREFLWVPLEESLGMDLNKPTRILIEAILKDRARTAGTAADGVGVNGADWIRIEEIEVRAHVGVPDAERAERQRLLLSVGMASAFGPAAVSDDLSATIDYAAVCAFIKETVESRAWKLIETMAVQVAEAVLARFPAEAVRVGIQKFIIPGTRNVGVEVLRFRPRPGRGSAG